MNAIKMLKQQHREVEKLFSMFEAAKGDGPKRRAFEEIADSLAVHATIEERHFYPAVKEKQTEELLFESVEEHLQVKRAIADLMALDAIDETFEAKVKVMQENVEHHVEEEETELFPKVEQMFDDEALETLGAVMEQTEAELRTAGNPRDAVPSETEAAAPV
jgi:hemerythrin superfamily protein